MQKKKTIMKFSLYFSITMCDSKTPVTILQEFCVKNKEPVPHYEYKGEETSAENEKTFTYKIYTMGQESSGVGKSKKDAKHDAGIFTFYRGVDTRFFWLRKIPRNS
jgi:dsRNA-specific ribonuclease